MTGETIELQKESFWKEHQDTLVRLRHDLVSGKKSRPKFSPTIKSRNVTPNAAVTKKTSRHPPYGKYRRTPSPYLPKLASPAHQGKSLARPGKFEVVPPVKPKLAFIKSADDYDSWGEVSDDEAEDEEESDVDIDDDKADNRQQLIKDFKSPRKRRTQHKPQQYPNITEHKPPPVVYGVPFPVYYPPPPKGTRGNPRHQTKKPDKSYKERHSSRPAVSNSQTYRQRKKKKKKDPSSAPVYMSYPMIPTVLFPATLEEEEEMEEEEEADESAKAALQYWKEHPLFASDFTDWMIQDYLHTELVPDFLIETFNEIRHMPYDHPLYLPSLYTCEDILEDHVSELAMEIARQTVTEAASDYLDEKALLRDPLEDFLDSLMEDVVTAATREIVRSSVVELAEDYLTTQYANSIIHELIDDCMEEDGPELLEDTLFDLAAEEFINSEVIVPEVREEAEVIARETVQHYDNKVMRREFKEVRLLAEHKLADAVMMEFILSVMSQRGKLWTEDDHFSRYLDGVILNQSVTQMVNIKRQRDKTLHCKPLHKLHEKAVSDVALDVFLQQLTRSLDEDLADVDEYERGVTEGVIYPLSLVRR